MNLTGKARALRRSAAHLARTGVNQDLRRAEANLSALIESTTDLIWSVDRDYGLLTFNATFAEHFRSNYGIRAFLGAKPQQLVPTDRASLWAPMYERALTEGPYRLEYRLPDARVLELAFHPIQQGGEAVGISVFGKDITATQRAERDLQETKANLASLIESTTDMIWSVDLGFRLLAFNTTLANHFTETYGLTPAVGQDASMLLPRERASIWSPRYEQVLASGPLQVEDRLPDGRILEFNLHPIIHDQAAVGISVFGKDVTGRKVAEQALRVSEEKFRNLVDRAPMGVFRRSIDGPYVYLSRGLWEQFECESPEAYAEAYTTIEQRWTHPERHLYFRNLLLADRKVEGFEVETRLLSGKSKCFLFYAYLDEADPRFLDGFSVDVTDLKAAERDSLRMTEALHQSQKMDALGQLAGGISHDINNLLGGIMGAAELLQASGPVAAGPKGTSYLNMIVTSTQRAADLAHKLLAFARKGKRVETRVRVAGIVEETVGLLRSTLDKRVAVAALNLTEASTVAGDAASLQSVFLNMGINASHAMPDGGSLTFTVRNVLLDDYFCCCAPNELLPGAYVEIEVRDTGCGMPPDIMGRIFEPFFTTKTPGLGTGLGLAAAYGTVLDHHGLIQVYSEVGVGTAFQVYLPLLDGEALESRADAPVATSGSGTILLVEDEELLRMITQAMLEDLGYTVLTATDGQEGVAAFQRAHAGIGLVLLDMIMPVMGGREAFERMRAIDGTVPIVVTSGFSKDDDLREMKKLGLWGFLRKPCRRSELSRIAAAAMAREGTA